MYPSPEKVLEYANTRESRENVELPGISPMAFLEQLRQSAERDPLHELHEQERKIIWGLRYDCLAHFPQLLPKLLDCVEWNDHREVSVLY